MGGLKGLMKIYGHRVHFGKRIKKWLGIKNNWSSRIFGARKSVPVSSAGQISDRRLSNIS